MKAAVVIMNLGTPTEPTRPAVRAFLRDFLSDRRVVELFRPLWLFILYGIILTFRTIRVTRAYQKIWTDEGSPLRVISQKQVKKLQQRLTDEWGEQAPVVRMAMTYSGPSLEEVVNELEEQRVDHILLLPLYPQYSATTTGSIYDQVSKLTRERRNIPPIHIVKHYYQYNEYCQALAETVRANWQLNGQCERLILSFHSIPQAYVDAGDPYYQHCKQTAEMLAENLQLADDQWEMTFQSRLGFSKWLSPYTSVRVKELADAGIKHIDIICPAFSVDCLETLEEINIELKQLFLESGGQQCQVIPCLNDSSDHIDMMATIVNDYLPSKIIQQ